MKLGANRLGDITRYGASVDTYAMRKACLVRTPKCFMCARMPCRLCALAYTHTRKMLQPDAWHDCQRRLRLITSPHFSQHGARLNEREASRLRCSCLASTCESLRPIPDNPVPAGASAGAERRRVPCRAYAVCSRLQVGVGSVVAGKSIPQLRLRELRSTEVWRCAAWLPSMDAHDAPSSSPAMRHSTERHSLQGVIRPSSIPHATLRAQQLLKLASMRTGIRHRSHTRDQRHTYWLLVAWVPSPPTSRVRIWDSVAPRYIKTRVFRMQAPAPQRTQQMMPQHTDRQARAIPETFVLLLHTIAVTARAASGYLFAPASSSAVTLSRTHTHMSRTLYVPHSLTPTTSRSYHTPASSWLPLPRC